MEKEAVVDAWLHYSSIMMNYPHILGLKGPYIRFQERNSSLFAKSQPQLLPWHG